MNRRNFFMSILVLPFLKLFSGAKPRRVGVVHQEWQNGKVVLQFFGPYVCEDCGKVICKTKDGRRFDYPSSHSTPHPEEKPVFFIDSITCRSSFPEVRLRGEMWTLFLGQHYAKWKTHACDGAEYRWLTSKSVWSVPVKM